MESVAREFSWLVRGVRGSGCMSKEGKRIFSPAREYRRRISKESGWKILLDSRTNEWVLLIDMLVRERICVSDADIRGRYAWSWDLTRWEQWWWW